MQYGSAVQAGHRTSTILRRTVIAFLVIANLAVFGGLLYLSSLRNTVQASVNVIPVEQLPAIQAPTQEAARQDLYLLLVGSDSRANLPGDFEGAFGDFEGQRADVIMLVHLMPARGKAQLISLPRDLKITRSDGTVEKLNAAFGRDVNELITEVAQVSGVDVNHYVEVDFVGFAAIVDALGGVKMYFPYPSRDIKSGLDVPAGDVLMDGPTALAFARSRTFEEFRDGTWVSVPGNDIDRTHRQQQLIFAILGEMKRPSNALGMQRLVESVGNDITTDSGLDFDTLVNLAWDMRSFDAADLEAVTLPIDYATIAGISYVVPKEPDADQLLARFAAGEPLVPEAPTRVDVLNGNGIAGSAGVTSGYLQGLGYTIVTVGNADSSDYATTRVVAAAADLDKAARVVESLGFGEATVGVVPAGTDVVIFLGKDAADFVASNTANGTD